VRSGIQVRVVNLDRSPQRLEAMAENLAAVGLPFERLPAVDAGQLAAQEIAAVYDAEANRHAYFVALKRGEIGCFLSHRKAWAEFLANGQATHLVVLEDDVAFSAPPQTVLDAIADYLDAVGPCMVKLYAQRPASGRKLCDLGPGYRLVRPVLAPLGTQAQMLNRDAARRLLEATARFHEPIDVTLQRTWDTGVDILVATPDLVLEISERLGGTTLRAVRQEPLGARLLREWRRPWFRGRRRLQAWMAAMRG
jgi:glycosyl transferase, family 25